MCYFPTDLTYPFKITDLLASLGRSKEDFKNEPEVLKNQFNSTLDEFDKATNLRLYSDQYNNATKEKKQLVFLSFSKLYLFYLTYDYSKKFLTNDPSLSSFQKQVLSIKTYNFKRCILLNEVYYLLKLAGFLNKTNLFRLNSELETNFNQIKTTRNDDVKIPPSCREIVKHEKKSNDFRLSNEIKNNFTADRNDVTNNSAAINAHKRQISVNKANIKTNTAVIATNRANIVRNKVKTATQKTSIIASARVLCNLKSKVSGLTSAIATNKTAITNNVRETVRNRKRINQNDTIIAQLKAQTKFTKITFDTNDRAKCNYDQKLAVSLCYFEIIDQALVFRLLLAKTVRICLWHTKYQIGTVNPWGPINNSNTTNFNAYFRDFKLVAIGKHHVNQFMPILDANWMFSKPKNNVFMFPNQGGLVKVKSQKKENNSILLNFMLDGINNNFKHLLFNRCTIWYS